MVVEVAIGIREAELAGALVGDLLGDLHHLAGRLGRGGYQLLVVDERGDLVVQRQAVHGAPVRHRIQGGGDEALLQRVVHEEVDGLDGVARFDPAAQPVLREDEEVRPLAARHGGGDLVGEGVIRHRQCRHLHPLGGVGRVVLGHQLVHRRLLLGAVGVPEDQLGGGGGQGQQAEHAKTDGRGQQSQGLHGGLQESGGKALLGLGVEEVQRVQLHAHRQRVAGLGRLRRGEPVDEGVGALAGVDDDLVAQGLDDLHLRLEGGRLAARGQPGGEQVVGADAHLHLEVALARGHRAQALGHRQAEALSDQRGGLGVQGGVQEVHRRGADELGDEDVGGALVHLQRRAELLQLAILHHRDAVAHRHRFDLIVRHVDARHAQALLELFDLRAHGHAQLGVQVGQRLVEEEHGRLAHDGAAQGHALALATGQLFGLAVQEVGDGQHLGRLVHQLVHLRARRLADLQAELEVLPHGHVRIERVVLEHHRHVALLGRELVHHAAADGDGAAGDLLQAGDHPQRGGFTAARGPHEHQELMVLDVEVEPLDDGHSAVPLRHVLERYLGHPALFPVLRCLWVCVVSRAS
ncbi:conserved hypothetical protein [Stigmatella aurantiaca DW4/3-1]|uniref:Uncharacterized protein n=1 Tax=Stigmatella aurantiaca (strain DW4/3-1) TaxID=378806 RepID=Q09AM4_STIAD|nr:conserved hypothetical protein [Stigmatella aurantiaca DW4/3-1]